MDIKIYDSTFNPVGILDVFDSLIWTDKFWDVGEFQIYTRLNSTNIDLLRSGYVLSIPASDQLMVVDTIQIKADIEAGSKLIVKGRSLVQILDRRIVWAQTNLDGDFQDGIEQLLDENVISPTDTDREIPNFIFVPTTNAEVLSWNIVGQFFGDNVLSVIQEQCAARSLGFKLIYDGQFKFSIYAGTDRSFNQFVNPHIVFSPKFDNLTSSDYVETIIAAKTVALIAGEGDGTARETQTKNAPGGAGTGFNRKELFVDASGVSQTIDGGTMPLADYQDLLKAEGEVALAENTSVTTFESDVDTRVNYIYGRDFFLGDIVQTENEYGMRGAMRVSEFIISEDVNGYKTYPKFEMV